MLLQLRLHSNTFKNILYVKESKKENHHIAVLCVTLHGEFEFQLLRIFFPEANPKIESAVPECVDVVSCDLKKTLLYSHTEYMVSQQCQWAACAGAQTQNPLKILSQIFNKIKQASDRSNDGKSGNQINF